MVFVRYNNIVVINHSQNISPLNGNSGHYRRWCYVYKQSKLEIVKHYHRITAILHDLRHLFEKHKTSFWTLCVFKSLRVKVQSPQK